MSLWVKFSNLDIGMPVVNFSCSARELAIKCNKGEIKTIPTLDDSSVDPDKIEKWFIEIVEKIWPEYKGGCLIGISAYGGLRILFQYCHKDLPRLQLYNTRAVEYDLFNRCVDCGGAVCLDDMNCQRVCIPEPEISE